MKNMKIDANGTEIRVMGDVVNDDAYVSLTDIAKYKNPDNAFIVVANWMRNHSTISFLGLWKQIHNPNSKPIEFDRLKAESGDNAFTLTPQQWIKATDAIGIVSKSGRYGGTYAHTDIAFEFASWISPEFLNVNEGDCIWIEHPSEHNTIIDISNGQEVTNIFESASSSGNYNQKNYPVNPIEYLKDRNVSTIFRFVLTHPDMDHMD